MGTKNETNLTSGALYLLRYLHLVTGSDPMTILES